MEVELRRPEDGQRRRLTADDLFQLEELGEAALSPDGRWLAYVVKRPRSTAKFHKYDFLLGGDRGDVWLVDTSGGVPENLTQGAAEGSGYWALCWSPDSERLAMLSTKGATVRVWVCDTNSRDLALLSDRSVDLNSTAPPHVWLSASKVLVATLPEGERPIRMAVEVKAAEAAMCAWPQAWKGQEAIASVLDSGFHAPFEGRPQGELLLVDAVSGREECVVRGSFRELRIAPDRRHVAFFRQLDVHRPQATRKLEHASPGRHRLGIVTADGDVVSGGVEEIEDPITTSLRWSPDSAEVALIARGGKSPEASRVLFRYRLADGCVQPAAEASLEPTSIVWTSKNGILALVTPGKDTPGQGTGRADWWLVSDDHEPCKLTADTTAVPTRLFPQEGREAFVGLADGDIVRLNVGDGRWTT